MREKIPTRKKLRTRTLSTQWSGIVVHKLKFVFASPLRDKFITLVYKVVSLVFNDKLFFVQTEITNTCSFCWSAFFWNVKLHLRLCIEFLKSPVFLRKLCICPMIFMIEWFLMVSISLLKCTFAGSVVYFSMIVSKIWCNFCFVYYVRNLELIGKGAVRLITVYCFSVITSLYFSM